LRQGFVEELADARQRFDDRLIGGDFAIEHAQGIGHRPALAIGAHLVLDRLKRLRSASL
jgi:hypothetical protein